MIDTSCNESSRLSWLVRGLSLLAILLAPATGGTAFALILLALGIPHGAADHLIFRSRLPPGIPFRAPAFLAFYFVIVGLYALLWWGAPELALLVFLGVSVYHFGQPYGGNPASRLLWGCFLLGFPVLYHYPQAAPIVNGMLGYDLQLPPWVATGIPTLLVTANLSFALLNHQQQRLVDLLILGVVFVCTDLLLGFAIFFLLWHALPALIEQWKYLSRHRLSRGWGSYLLQLLPLTLGAFVSMGLAYLLLHQRGSQMPDLSYVFIMVSLITLPHAFLVDRVYRA